jgi:diguanylate cyclase (GGDEF)-like protein
LEKARLQLARVGALYAAAWPAYYGSLAVAGVLLLALWDLYPAVLLAGWFLVLTAVMAARGALHWSFAHRKHATRDPALWERRFALATLAAGATWTFVPLVLFPHGDPLLQATVVVFVGGVIITGAALSAASPLALYALTTLPLLTLAAQLFLQGTPVHALLGFGILLFGFVIARMCREIRRSIVAAFEAREDLRAAMEEAEHRAEMVRFLAYHDSLTGLPNRRLLDDRLRQAVLQAQRRGSGVAVLLIDLDDFKQVNDSAGHRGGDAVLREVASRLGSCVRKTDTVARHGGDEFVVVLADAHSLPDCQGVAEKVLAALAPGFLVEGRSFRLGASIGIATFPADAGDADALLRGADAAMYRAKQTGRNQYRFYGR